jgi:hypothetical protein
MNQTALKSYYVREIGTRKEQLLWVSIRGESETDARDRFIKELHLQWGPEKNYLTRKHIAVRTTPPSRGGVGHFETYPPGSIAPGMNYFVEDHISRRAPRKAKGTGGSLVDRQMRMLIQKADELKVIPASEDGTRKNKKVLLTLKPRSFLWIVNKYGSKVWPLDTQGKGRAPLAFRFIEDAITDTTRSSNKGFQWRIFLITGATIKEVSPKEARVAVDRAKAVKRGESPRRTS